MDDPYRSMAIEGQLADLRTQVEQLRATIETLAAENKRLRGVASYRREYRVISHYDYSCDGTAELLNKWSAAGWRMASITDDFVVMEREA